MRYMINCLALAVVILLSVFVLTGCSDDQLADEAISNANKSISEHNELFAKARSTYADVKQKIESGADHSEEKDSIAAAKNTLEKARKHLQDARESLGTVADLDVDPSVTKYARLQSEAMDVQLAAEAKEIEFYGILEEDPALQNNREKANDLLSEVGNDYQKAKKIYDEAKKVADANPKLIEPAPE
jgi:hypothetical protein